MRSELQLQWHAQLNDLVTALAWSPSGDSWAASSASGEAIWISASGTQYRLKEADGRSLDRIAFSADGRWLAAGGQAGQLQIWKCDFDRSALVPADAVTDERQIFSDIANGLNDRDNPSASDYLPPQLVKTIEVDRWIEHLIWHPTDSRLVISHDSQVKIWDSIADRIVTTWQFDKSSIFDLGWHPMGSSLALAGYKGVQICSADERLTHVQYIEVDTASIKIAWSSDGRYLAAANLDRSITLMDWQHPEDPWILQGCPSKIRDLDWVVGTNTPCLAVASGVDVILWDLTPELTAWNGRYLAGHQSKIAALSPHPQVPALLSGDDRGYVCRWSALGEVEQILDNIVSGITTMKWHPEGICLAVGRSSGSLELWVASA